MGLYISVYALAGFKMKQPIEVITVKKSACKKCKGVTLDKFCRQCGGEVGFIDIQTEQWVCMEDIIGSDNLCHDYLNSEYMTIYSNSLESIQLEENEKISISPELITEKISDFKKAHKEDIEKIEAFIGEKVEVEFFLVYDYS